MLCLATQTNKHPGLAPDEGSGCPLSQGAVPPQTQQAHWQKTQTHLKDCDRKVSEKPKEITKTYFYRKSSTTWIPLKRNLELCGSHNFSGCWAAGFKQVLFYTFRGYYLWLKLSMNICYIFKSLKNGRVFQNVFNYKTLMWVGLNPRGSRWPWAQWPGMWYVQIIRNISGILFWSYCSLHWHEPF